MLTGDNQDSSHSGCGPSPPQVQGGDNATRHTGCQSQPEPDKVTLRSLPDVYLGDGSLGQVMEIERTMRILFCGSTFPDAPQFLREKLPRDAGDEIVVWSRGDLRPMLDGVDVIIPKMQRIDRHLMQSGDFQLIQQWGAGLEGIDLDAARSENIWVSNVSTLGANAESVAEQAILLILCLLRNLPLAQSNVRYGILGAPLGSMLAGRSVCLYGLGAIALALARRLASFGVRLIGNYQGPKLTQGCGVWSRALLSSQRAR